jgi:hypothetical protein
MLLFWLGFCWSDRRSLEVYGVAADLPGDRTIEVEVVSGARHLLPLRRWDPILRYTAA